MNLGFEFVSAKSKKDAAEDAPTRSSMRPAGIRSSVSTDQKKVRRAMNRGVRKSAEKETVMSQRREAEILQAMAVATPAEQIRLAADLEALRGQRAASLQAERDLDLANTVVTAHLTPVRVHEVNTSGTDWLSTVASGSGEDPTLAMKTEATLWFGRTSAEVKGDREEFGIQAQGAARLVAGRYGEQADMARRAFLDHVAHLHRTASDGRTIDKDKENGQGESSVTSYDGLAPVTEDKAFTDDAWAEGDEPAGVHPPMPGAGGQASAAKSKAPEDEDDYDPYADKPFGEEQAIIDHLETRYDFTDAGDLQDRWYDDDYTASKKEAGGLTPFGEWAVLDALTVYRVRVGGYNTETGEPEGTTTGGYGSLEEALEVAQEAVADGWTSVDVVSENGQVIQSVAAKAQASRQVTASVPQYVVVADDGIAFARGNGGLLTREEAIAICEERNVPGISVLHRAYQVGDSQRIASQKTAGTDEDDQNGNAESGLPQVEVGTATEVKFPWELEANQPGTGAADVASVPTPGGESGYPKASAKEAADNATAIKLLEQNIANLRAQMASAANKDEARRRLKAMQDRLADLKAQKSSSLLPVTASFAARVQASLGNR